MTEKGTESRFFIVPSFSLQEYYEFIESDSSDIFRKLGNFAWLGVAIAFVETLVVIKFGHGLFLQPWPTSVVWTWTIVGALCVTAFTAWSIRFYQRYGTIGSVSNTKRRDVELKENERHKKE